MWLCSCLPTKADLKLIQTNRITNYLQVESVKHYTLQVSFQQLT